MKKIKTDLENLNILHRINRISNSPKYIRNLNNYHELDIKRKNNNKLRTIFLQKTTPISNFPVCVKVQIRNSNNHSYSPKRNLLDSSSYSKLNIDNSFTKNSSIKDKCSFNYEKNCTKNKINDDNENSIYRNIGQINKLKNSLGNPKQARNIMINNNGRKNRFTSASSSQNSNNENNDYLKYNDIDIEENNFNFDEKHKMRYLLSKDHINKLKVRKKNKPKNGGIFNIMNYSFKDILNRNEKIESSPGHIINISEINKNQEKKENNMVNNINAKKLTPIQKTGTPHIIPEDKIFQEEEQINDFNINPNNIFLNNNNFINNNKIVEIKLKDLIFIEGRLNDIILALNNENNIFGIRAINESVDFFIFYFHSSLKNKLTLFFMEQNRIIIKSAFNLNLFIIMITYYLSLDQSILIKNIILLKQIYNLLKMNLYLIIRKIELYYGDDFCSKNEKYFKTYNYYLNKNGLSNIYEKEIIIIINNNCISILNDLNNILNFLYTINNKYYYDFKDIYLNISRINEQYINNYLYNNLFNLKKENLLIKERNNHNDSILINKNTDNSSDYTIQNIIQNQIIKQQQEYNDLLLDEIIMKYKKNKEIPPFLKNKNSKKYTLVLGVENTIINVRIDPESKLIIRPRPGLISFLNGIKNYYEIISFSTLSKSYSSTIIQQIEDGRKLFDYNLYREHCTLM